MQKCLLEMWESRLDWFQSTLSCIHIPLIRNIETPSIANFSDWLRREILINPSLFKQTIAAAHRGALALRIRSHKYKIKQEKILPLCERAGQNKSFVIPWWQRDFNTVKWQWKDDKHRWKKITLLIFLSIDKAYNNNELT